MKATELRIGNLVEYMGKIEPVTSQMIRDCELNNAVCQPVEITGEWVESKQWKYMYNSEDVYFGDGFNLYFTASDTWLLVSPTADLLFKPKYIHEVQNIYYMLTGEELT